MKNTSFQILILLLTIIGTGCNSIIEKYYPFPKGRVVLTHPPIDLSGVEYFFPMGGLNVLPKAHGGFTLLGAYTFPASTPVYAVADGLVIRVSNGTREVPPIPDAPQSVWHKTYDDHLLTLKVSKSMLINYGHITDFSPELLDKLPKLKKSEDGIKVAVEVKAGDIIGYVGPHGAMDFSITDRNLNPSFLNPKRYPKDYIYSGNIFEYFETELTTEMVKKAFRKTPPRGGKIDYDQKGKIIGNWFLRGTESFIQWSRQLAIAYHDLFPERITISDGSPMQDVPGIENPGAPDVWWVKGNTPAPESIGVENGLVRYVLLNTQDHRDKTEYKDNEQPVQGIMLVQALDDEKIQVEIFRGSTTANEFTTEARIYER